MTRCRILEMQDIPECEHEDQRRHALSAGVHAAPPLLANRSIKSVENIDTFGHFNKYCPHRLKL